MPGCVFHIRGSFDPEAFLRTSSLSPYSVFRRGEPILPGGRLAGRIHDRSGFKCEVSPPGRELDAQVRDAVAFLRTHHGDLVRLASFPAVEDRRLNFGHRLRLDGVSVTAQCDYLPPDLLRLAGELGIGIELSLYPEATASEREEYPAPPQSPPLPGRHETHSRPSTL
jgi:hypothetical protein